MRTHCGKGHKYTPETEIPATGTTRRRCRTCRREWDRKRATTRRALAKKAATERPSTPKRKYPVEPLLTVARSLGVAIEDRKAIERAKYDGELSETVADRLACKVLKVHPSLIWGEAWWDFEEAS